MVKIAVVGAGVIGLSCALNVQQQIPGAKVTIIADRFDKDTTSWGAGGIFRPTLKRIQGPSADVVKQWLKESWNHFSGLAQSSLAAASGNSLVSGFDFSNTKQDPFYKEIVVHTRDLTPSELRNLKVPYQYGLAVTTTITEVKKYLPWLMNKFRDQGGQVEFHTLRSLRELVDLYDIVVNCPGMGARELVGDESIYPIRGQLLTIKAPWVKDWMFTDDDTYILIHSETVTIGGCRQRDVYNTDIDPEMSKDIIRRSKKLMPALEGAEVVEEWVGLRPTRFPVRVEKETMCFGGQKLRVVHNYGHGANGISLSWGTAVYAAGLVKDFLKEINYPSKL